MPHGRPHGLPTANGSKEPSTACANGTGSSGTSHAATVTGTDARSRAGVRRSRTKRSTRNSASWFCWYKEDSFYI